MAAWVTAPRTELAWLRDRKHIAREVAKHSQNGLDTWMVEGLDFLNEHEGHTITLVSRR